MTKVSRVYTRLSINDLILNPEQMEKFESVAKVLFDEDNQVFEDLEFYTVGHEDEKGVECDEEGNYFDTKYGLTLTLIKLRENWTHEDFKEAYSDEWEDMPTSLEVCFSEMEDYIYSTYEEDYIQELIENEG